jgi:hypothetical protein
MKSVFRCSCYRNETNYNRLWGEKKILIEAEEWKAMLKRLLVLTLFLASRGLPFQGEGTKIGAVNNGNFVGIIELLGHDDEITRKFIQSPKKSVRR